MVNHPWTCHHLSLLHHGDGPGDGICLPTICKFKGWSIIKTNIYQREMTLSSIAVKYITELSRWSMEHGTAWMNHWVLIISEVLGEERLDRSFRVETAGRQCSYVLESYMRLPYLHSSLLSSELKKALFEGILAQSCDEIIHSINRPVSQFGLQTSRLYLMCVEHAIHLRSHVPSTCFDTNLTIRTEQKI